MSALARDTAAGTSLTISQELSTFALGLSHAQIPIAVRDRAKHLILDSVGIALASTKYPYASISFAALEQLGAGTSPVIGIGRRLALRDAVLMNGILIHGLDFDDTHSRGVIHATSSSFPCALALAERDDQSGKALLAAYVAAMEVATRLGSVAKGGFHQVGFHPTGLVGAFGCTLAAARLLGLDENRATMAQGIALSMASGSLEFLQDGSWTKRMHPGWAAVAGITAARLAQYGFKAPTRPYEGKFGFFDTHLQHPPAPIDLPAEFATLGSVWELAQTAVKPYPVCHFIHGCADAAIGLYDEIDSADIVRAEALLPRDTMPIVAEPQRKQNPPRQRIRGQVQCPVRRRHLPHEGRIRPRGPDARRAGGSGRPRPRRSHRLHDRPGFCLPHLLFGWRPPLSTRRPHPLSSCPRQ